MSFFDRFSFYFLEGQVREWLAKEVASIGKDNLLWLIDHNRSILDYYSVEEIEGLKQYAPLFKDADLMAWLSPETLKVIRSNPKGEAWMREQMRLLKERLGVG